MKIAVFPISFLRVRRYNLANVFSGMQRFIMANSDAPASNSRSPAPGKASMEVASLEVRDEAQRNNRSLKTYGFSSPELRDAIKRLNIDQQLPPPGQIFNPCTNKAVDIIPAPPGMPKALDSVKDRDPALFKDIQSKVIDPRYTGELGNITVSTHDKKGRVNGCVFEQNVPYWESGLAAKALVDVNKELAVRGKKLEADPLNGAGRTLAQEEAIAWRNTGLHAKVGKSNHGFGKAEDFKPDPDSKATRQPWQDRYVNAILHANGWRQGDTWGPLRNDLHHWSFAGPGPVTDGPPVAHKLLHAMHHKHG